MRKITKTLLGATVALPLAMAAVSVPAARAGCGPCKPKAAKPCSPCAAKKAKAPCSPCAAKKAKGPCKPCNPCAPKKKM